MSHVLSHNARPDVMRIDRDLQVREELYKVLEEKPQFVLVEVTRERAVLDLEVIDLFVCG